MKTINEEIAAIDDTLRSFNIDRPDIKEIWETGRFGTIAVPADRYKQYYDTIKSLQAELAERDRVISNGYYCPTPESGGGRLQITSKNHGEAAITKPTEE